jgi:hypothetical protein
VIDIRVTTGRTAFLDLLIDQRKLDAAIREAVRGLAREYRQRLVAQLRAPKAGRTYAARDQRGTYRRTKGVVRRLSVSTKRYRASAPGQAPAVQTGTMLRSIKTKIGGRGGAYSARIFADRRTAFYRHFLEFGVGQRQIRRGKQFDGKSKRQRLRARNVASSGAVAPRPVWSPLQTSMSRDLQARVLAAVQGFAR